MLIWDLEENPPQTDSIVILWSRYCENKNTISIVKYVEDNSDEIRTNYLKWIYDLGEHVIEGKKIIEHLNIRKNLSYWWMTSLAQKVNIDSSQNINKSIKLLGLERLVKTRCPKKIKIVTHDEDLILIVKNLCLSYNIAFSAVTSKVKFKKLIYGLSSTISALIYFLWYLIRSVPLILSLKKNQYNNNVIFIDIFTHIYGSTYNDYHFKSYYWEDLVLKLKEWKIKSNWVHIYYRNKKNKSFLRVKRLCNFLTLNSLGMQDHALLESNLNFKIFYNVIKDYIKIKAKTNVVLKLNEIKPQGSNLDLWKLHKNDLVDSLSGKNLIRNCLYINLFEKLMKDMPKKKIGIYISENQPWELALINAWRSAGHGILIAAPHNTLRYWDLRHYFHPQTYRNLNLGKYPMPNLLALNSPYALKNLVDSGYPSNNLIQVEALRFLYLLNGITSSKKIKLQHILVCADYQKNNTIKILDWLSDIKEFLPEYIKITYRPHPIYKLKINNYKNLNLSISNNNLLDDLSFADIVITGLISSVAADAYSFGKPVVQILDGTTLNMSPLRSIEGVFFARSKSDMLGILNRTNLYSTNRFFFNLNEDLHLWKTILTNFLCADND